MDGGEQRRREAARTGPGPILAVLSLAGLSYSILSTIVSPALPDIMRALGTDETGVTWMMTSFLLAATVGTAIIGRLGDMFGKERLLIWALGLLALGTLISAVVDTLALQIVGRFVQGAAGGIFPLAFGIVRDEFPPERVAGGIGLLSAVLGIGSSLGVVCSGLLVDNLGYHWIFWLPLAAASVAALLVWRLVPESPVRVPGRVNWPAAALMTAGLSAVLVAISEGPQWGWGSARTLLLGAAGLAVAAAWVAVELRSRTLLIDMAMMRRRGVWTANAVALLLGCGMFGSFAIYPQLAQLPAGTGYGASVLDASLYLLPATIAAAVLGVFAGPIAARFGSRAALIAGTGFALASFVWIALAHAEPWQMLVSTALLGIGVGLCFAALGNLVVRAVPAQQTAVATGVNTVMRTLGGALGAQLGATLIAAGVSGGAAAATGFTASFWMFAGFQALALVAALLVPRRRLAEPAR